MDDANKEDQLSDQAGRNTLHAAHGIQQHMGHNKPLHELHPQHGQQQVNSEGQQQHEEELQPPLLHEAPQLEDKLQDPIQQHMQQSAEKLMEFLQQPEAQLH
ncbi:hypothetical protein DACRYDRAFT_16218 [Dacryopinax primogenitus]|uniref:Uncharacterized protein n=1 Tax=Dacryopinax primogenitus (strain DJM 731) TaxID=1858805 RepID=M5FUW1_DACPD|nr:uncharacterized protein DACRYDRAFT_16218 [Dacryopinax primogenitus]EJU01556.1 hypothetical protein DACRYDRAFT_16218 [Dacryopinax primogenitus]